MTYVTNAMSEQKKAGSALAGACEVCALPNLGPAESDTGIWAMLFSSHYL